MFVGRNDAGRPVGVVDAGRLLTDLPNKIRNALGITVDVNLLHEAGREGSCDVLEIITPAYAVPISLRGRYYFRSGSTNQELTGGALNEFLLKKAGRTCAPALARLKEPRDADDVAYALRRAGLPEADEIERIAKAEKERKEAEKGEQAGKKK